LHGRRESAKKELRHNDFEASALLKPSTGGFFYFRVVVSPSSALRIAGWFCDAAPSGSADQPA
jgi:hypothetical protein